MTRNKGEFLKEIQVVAEYGKKFQKLNTTIFWQQNQQQRWQRPPAKRRRQRDRTAAKAAAAAGVASEADGEAKPGGGQVECLQRAGGEGVRGIKVDNVRKDKNIKLDVQ